MIKTNKKVLISGVSILVIVVTSYILSAYAFKLPPFAGTAAVTQGEHVINMEKSDTEKQTESDLKNNPSKKTESGVDVPDAPKVDSSTDKQIANVLITSADVINGQVDVRGFVTNVVETNGVCKVTFTQGATTVVKETGILAGGTTSTSCQAVKFSKDELSVGSWKVELEYMSPESYGKAAAVTMEVR